MNNITEYILVGFVVVVTIWNYLVSVKMHKMEVEMQMCKEISMIAIMSASNAVEHKAETPFSKET